MNISSLFIFGIVALSALGSAISTYTFLNYKPSENENSSENIGEISNELNDIDPIPSTTDTPDWWHDELSMAAFNLNENTYILKKSSGKVGEIECKEDCIYAMTKFGESVFEIEPVNSQHIFQFLVENPELGGAVIGVIGTGGVGYSLYKIFDK